MKVDSRSRSNARDRRIVTRLGEWFEANARPMAWRDAPPGKRDPYRTLVSELMLQQTQAARVEDRFARFIDRFPSIDALADAHEADVLAMWSGLGYYRRARHLHAAAQALRRDHAGVMPRAAPALRAMPGIGRYTAGAIASLCFDDPVPAVDGNVSRVLDRLEGASLGDSRESERRAWCRADELMRATGRPGLLTESLIELGATVCTPRSPACDRCPIARDCRSAGIAEQRRAETPRRREMWCAALLVRDARARLLVERRPDAGLWAGLHQTPTLESLSGPIPSRTVRSALPVSGTRRIDRFDVQTSHRHVHFDVYLSSPLPRARLAGNGRHWLSPRSIEPLALGTPQRRILLRTPGMLRA
ncbi:MAG: A/G-specific adenine glycosylase [Phycisphaeraceae bacterium]|nr:A/G-specific adenine glycosylase [Phycisphaeraceae bacterium]